MRLTHTFNGDVPVAKSGKSRISIILIKSHDVEKLSHVVANDELGSLDLCIPKK